MLSKIAQMVPILGIAPFVVAAALPQAATQAPRKILFVGDSFTYYQNGIYTHFERLAAAATPPLVVTADKSVFGGASLRRLWDLKEPVKAIDTATYDVVVLQEDIPETTIADFRDTPASSSLRFERTALARCCSWRGPTRDSAGFRWPRSPKRIATPRKS